MNVIALNVVVRHPMRTYMEELGDNKYTICMMLHVSNGVISLTLSDYRSYSCY